MAEDLLRLSLQGCHQLPRSYFIRCSAMQALAQLILQHSSVVRWLMKIDDEHLGRGHAYLDVAAVPAIATALQLYATTLDKVPGTYAALCPLPVLEALS